MGNTLSGFVAETTRNIGISLIVVGVGVIMLALAYRRLKQTKYPLSNVMYNPTDHPGGVVMTVDLSERSIFSLETPKQKFENMIGKSVLFDLSLPASADTGTSASTDASVDAGTDSISSRFLDYTKDIKFVSLTQVLVSDVSVWNEDSKTGQLVIFPSVSGRSKIQGSITNAELQENIPIIVQGWITLT